jgi:hypothetical protein
MDAGCILDRGVPSRLVSVGPHAALGLEETCKAKHRSVDWALSLIDEQIVQKSAKYGAKEWGHHGYLQYVLASRQS